MRLNRSALPAAGLSSGSRKVGPYDLDAERNFTEKDARNVVQLCQIPVPRSLPLHRSVMMPSIKRQASDSFSGPNHSLVKRQKSNSDLKENGALAVTSQGKGKDGALIQLVSLALKVSAELSGLNFWIKVG